MKFGIIADIHGNLHALKAIIRDLEQQGIHDYIIAGDLIADCSQPNEVLDYIKTLKATVIKGNREDYVLDFLSGKQSHWSNYDQMASVVWTAKVLTNENVRYIKSLSNSAVISLSDVGRISVVHGSPFDVSEHLYEDKEQKRLLEAVLYCGTEVLICGHSHRPWQKKVNQTLVLNPGAAGIHFNKQRGAEYAILSFENGTWSASHHVALYDILSFKEEMVSSSLMQEAPTWASLIVQSIEEGFNANIEFLKTFESSAFQNGLIPNEIWQLQASKWFENTIVNRTTPSIDRLRDKKAVNVKLNDTEQKSLNYLIPFLVATDLGLSNDGAIDNTDLMQRLVQQSHIQGKTIFFPKGTYMFSDVALESKLHFLGEPGTIFRIKDGANSIFTVRGKNDIRFEYIDFFGGHSTDKPITLKNQVGVSLANSTRISFENCMFRGFGKTGLYVTQQGAGTGNQYSYNLFINACRFEQSYFGMMFDTRAEYSNIVGCTFGQNYWGAFVGGGNNQFTNCQFNNNQNGLWETGGSAYPNDSHNSFTGCQFNHNGNNHGIALRLSDVNVGVMFTGCQFFYGITEFTGTTTGVIFTGCEGGGNWIHKSQQTGKVMYTDCYFFTVPIIENPMGNTIYHNNLPDDIFTESLFVTGEIKTLFYDAGKEIEIGGKTWIRCEGQNVSITTLPKLYNKLRIETGLDDIEEEIFLPVSEKNKYLYICID